MNWKKARRREEYFARSDDEQIGYVISCNRSGKYYIRAYLAGGAECQLPWQEFDTVEETKKWVEEYEQKRTERNAKYADEEPLKW